MFGWRKTNHSISRSIRCTRIYLVLPLCPHAQVVEHAFSKEAVFARLVFTLKKPNHILNILIYTLYPPHIHPKEPLRWIQLPTRLLITVDPIDTVTKKALPLTIGGAVPVTWTTSKGDKRSKFLLESNTLHAYTSLKFNTALEQEILSCNQHFVWDMLIFWGVYI